MQQLQHKSTLPHIKHKNAKAIAEAIFNIKSPTRGSIAQYAGVTEMTVCRAITKLGDSGFTQENTVKKQALKNSASNISIADNLKLIIIDLTHDEYAIYLLSSSLKMLDKFSYIHNYSLDLSDNLSIFLSRAHSQFSKKANHFSGIAVIWNDKNYNDKDAIDAIGECFAAPITASLKISDCLESLRASAIDPHLPAENMYYLNLGSRNFAYFVTKDYTIKSNPQMLVTHKGDQLGDKIKECLGAEQLYEIILSVINSASAILDAKLYLIESDRFILGNNMGFSISEKLKLKFGDRRKIFVSDAKPNYYVKGAAIALQTEIIKNILTN